MCLKGFWRRRELLIDVEVKVYESAIEDAVWFPPRLSEDVE